jgi:hypothetical protein
VYTKNGSVEIFVSDIYREEEGGRGGVVRMRGYELNEWLGFI